jgi:hypothetical protein
MSKVLRRLTGMGSTVASPDHYGTDLAFHHALYQLSSAPITLHAAPLSNFSEQPFDVSRLTSNA